MNDVNNEGDSSDSDNDDEHEEQSSDDELSFESDDDGHFQQNLNKKHNVAAESDEEEDDFDDEELDEELDDEEEHDDDEEGDDEENVYESDDSEALSFEDVDSDTNETIEIPSTSSEVQKKQSAVKKNGTDKSKPNIEKSNIGNKTQVKKNEPNAIEAFKNELNKSGDKVSKQNGTGVDEYEKHDTDDEEDIRNTVGNIPMQWYDEYKHIGYDWDAKKIIKPQKRDQLDDFLKRMEDPNFWRTVKDPQTGQDVILSEADIDLIKRINSKRVPDASFDDYTVCIFNGSFFFSLSSMNYIFYVIFFSHG